jgi:protein TonB
MVVAIGQGRTARQALPAAVLWSLAAHLVCFAWGLRSAPAAAIAALAPRARGTVEFTAELNTPSAPVGRPAQGQLQPPTEAGPPAPTLPGPADAFSRDLATPWARADVDTPDPRAAARGGRQSGGTPSWTGRNDLDQELHAQPWNDPDTYRLERHRDAGKRRSPESIVRESAPDVDNAHRDRERRALAGEQTAAPQPDQGDPSAARLPAEAEGAEPRPGSPAPPADTRVSQLTEDGAIVTHEGRPVAKEGAQATEATVHGARSDNTDAAQASNEPHPIPLELTRPSAGGLGGTGVAGPSPGAGNSARSPRSGAGQGGTPSDIPERAGGKASTTARAQEAYLRRLHKRVNENLVFPPDLAASLEQGELVVSFTLRRDGSVADIRISRPSGYKQFDEAASAAVRRSAPFPPLPAVMTGGSQALNVEVPITFANPLIR